MGKQEDTFGLNDDAMNGKAPPSAKFVQWFHARVDTRQASDLHHRLGTAQDEAAFGNHTHDGKNSMPLFVDLTLTDISNTATGTQIATAVNALNAALRKLGAT